ncbi:MAG: hypothetical protein Q7S50_02840 [bacterium]|nr:hypothetical protein [bacterium]
MDMEGLAAFVVGVAALVTPIFGTLNYSGLHAAAGAVSQNSGAGEEEKNEQKYQCLPGYVYKVSPGENSKTKVDISRGNDSTKCVVLYCDSGGENCKPVGSRAAFTASQHADWGYIPSLCPTVINCDANTAQKADDAVARMVGYAEQKFQSSNGTLGELFPSLYQAPSSQQGTPVPSQDVLSQIQTFEDRPEITAVQKPEDNEPLSKAIDKMAVNLSAQTLVQETSAQPSPITPMQVLQTFGGDAPFQVTINAQPKTFAEQVVLSVQNEWNSARDLGFSDDMSKIAGAVGDYLLGPAVNFFGPHANEKTFITDDFGSLSQDYLDRLNQGPMPSLDPAVAAQGRQMQKENAELMHPTPIIATPEPFINRVVSWLRVLWF